MIRYFAPKYRFGIIWGTTVRYILKSVNMPAFGEA
ncbi:hypothetical protein J2Z65_003135 [Paenibacillus aceris]|uniref:Uncharacterized protein n=1 Tax=Paenibacillus aceris TaxID=869555 RepID=A0ABS4HZ30_9BACL|nr:hypothetical protein [Paenibacillus aceris]